MKSVARVPGMAVIDRIPMLLGSGIPATIAALLADLPPQGRAWTQDKRDKFMAMFEKMPDYNYKIVDPADDVMTDEAAACRRVPETRRNASLEKPRA